MISQGCGMFLGFFDEAICGNHRGGGRCRAIVFPGGWPLNSTMVTCCCMDSWIVAAPLKTNTAPKINGWKMEFPFRMVPFWGTFVHFRGRNMAVLLLWVIVSWLWCISTHLVGRFPGQDPDRDESVQAHHPSRPNCKTNCTPALFFPFFGLR